MDTRVTGQASQRADTGLTWALMRPRPMRPCSAAKLAEGMGRFREKEVATRDAFRKHVER